MNEFDQWPSRQVAGKGSNYEWETWKWKRRVDTKSPAKKKRVQTIIKTGTPNFTLELFALPFIVTRKKPKKKNTEKRSKLFFFFVLFCNCNKCVGWGHDGELREWRWKSLASVCLSLSLQNVSPHATMAGVFSSFVTNGREASIYTTPLPLYFISFWNPSTISGDPRALLNK